ncbi:hypothetical protein RAS1_02190 [Phycisphaerae bacterium RAS1]|nr:hypothetical protein RAS1_02190 [Phycisphaerae bacterium RAS1]
MLPRVPAILAVLAGVSAVSILAALVIFLPVDAETTTGEGAPLAVCWRVRSGEVVYDDWRRGPIYLAIYGPLYYQLIGRTAALLDADRYGAVVIARGLSVAATAFLGLLLVISGRRASSGSAWGTGPWPAFGSSAGTRPAGDRSPKLALVALLPLTWMPTEALRFLSSARPDAAAIAASLAAVVCLLGQRPRWAAATALALTAVWLKPTAVAALLSVVVAAATVRPPRTTWFWIGGIIVLGGGGALALNSCTSGGLAQHLLASRFAPQSWSNALGLVHRDFGAAAVIAGALLCAFILFRAGQISHFTRRHTSSVLSIYCIVAPLSAILFSRREGGDLNYFLESAAALGLALPTLIDRMAAARGRAAVQILLLAVTCFALPPARIADALTLSRAPLTALTPPLAEWTAAQPQPVLCLEPWLAYRSGAGGYLADRIAYTSLVRARPDLDTLTPLVARRRFASIILYGPVEDAGRPIYGDVPYCWPELVEAMRANYRAREIRFGWRAYEPIP